MEQIGYTLEAVHQVGGEPIVSLRLEAAAAQAIIRDVWPGIDFWEAPGGSSVQVETAFEAELIGRLIGACWIAFEPSRHRWLFHVHLT